MYRTYQYRLYPDEEQADALDVILRQSCLLYNEALEHRRDVYKHSGQSVSCFDQDSRFRRDRNARPEDFGLLNGRSMSYLLRRLDKAFAAFFRRVKAGGKPGFPRFKAARRFRSVEYEHGDGCKLRGDRLYVQHVGEIPIKLHRDVPAGCLKHVTLTRKAGDRWFVNFQGDDGELAPEPRTEGKAIGVDMGLMHLMAFSDGTRIANPRWLRRSLRKMRRAQRALSRKTRFSSRWWQRKRQVELLHFQISNQRRDFLHRVTNLMTAEFALIAVEDVSPRFMLSNHHLALSASDASWTMFRSMLDYKAERAGSIVVEVDARYTSQACSGCGRIEKKRLSERWHSCGCGTELDRDVNAAVNVLNKARCGPTGLNVDVVESSVPRETRRALLTA